MKMISNKNVFLFLDLDGVLVTSKQYLTNRKNWHPEYDRYKFDEKCVKIFNEIFDKYPANIVLSSDWKGHYNLLMLNRIFEINKVNTKIIDITPNLWGISYFKVQDLEECRAMEILKYVKEHKIEFFLAIDDLNLLPWLPNSFIHTPRSNEGIKQVGIKDKIINKLISIQ